MGDTQLGSSRKRLAQTDLPRRGFFFPVDGLPNLSGPQRANGAVSFSLLLDSLDHVARKQNQIAE